MTSPPPPAWATVTVTAYGRQQVRHVAEVTCLRYGSWHTRTVRLILARDEHTASGYDLALVTTDPATSPGALVARYATRWAIEQAFADARNVLDAGEARNRVRLAVERTVHFALLVHTLIIIWYARHGHDPAASWRCCWPASRRGPCWPARSLASACSGWRRSA